MTFEYIRVSYGWHMSTYKWHTDDILVHTTSIRMTYEYIRVIYGWHTSTYQDFPMWWERGRSVPLCSPILLILLILPPYNGLPRTGHYHSPPPPPIYKSVLSTPPEWNLPSSLGFPFLFHSMQRGANLLLENEPSRKWKISDLSQIFTVIQILDSKFLFLKQLWGH